MNVTCEKCGRDKRTIRYSMSITVFDPDKPDRVPRYYSVEFSTTVSERQVIGAISKFLKRYNAPVRRATDEYDEDAVVKYDFASSNGYLNLEEVRAFFRAEWPTSIQRMGQDSYEFDEETIY